MKLNSNNQKKNYEIYFSYMNIDIYIQYIISVLYIC